MGWLELRSIDQLKKSFFFCFWEFILISKNPSFSKWRDVLHKHPVIEISSKHQTLLRFSLKILSNDFRESQQNRRRACRIRRLQPKSGFTYEQLFLVTWKLTSAWFIARRKARTAHCVESHRWFLQSRVKCWVYKQTLLCGSFEYAGSRDIFVYQTVNTRLYLTNNIHCSAEHEV